MIVRKSIIIMLLGVIQCACGICVDTSEPMVIEVIGEEFNWYFRYPGSDGVLGNQDDLYSRQNLFLPENTRVKLKLASKDYIYSFALPEISKEEVAVPGMEFYMEFATGKEKRLTLLGDQFCGYSHKTLIGAVYVGQHNMASQKNLTSTKVVTKNAYVN